MQLAVLLLLLATLGAATCTHAAGAQQRRSRRATAPAGGSGPVATVLTGKLRGVHASPFADAFWGIPYAEPPVGALRWQPPRVAHSWNGTQEAARPGPSCIQVSAPHIFPSQSFPHTTLSSPCSVAADGHAAVWRPGRLLRTGGRLHGR